MRKRNGPLLAPLFPIPKVQKVHHFNKTGSGQTLEETLKRRVPAGRFLLAGTEAMMDWPMADAGSFDAITSTWLHIVLVVTPTSIMTYEDGTRVAEQQYLLRSTVV